MTSRVAVAAPNQASVQAALDIADDGGSAVDAAVAAMLVALVTEPGIVSLAGGAYATVWPAGTDTAVTVDGQVSMPGLGRTADAPAPDVRLVSTGYGGGVTMTVGPGTVATPGALAALDRVHALHGRRPWSAVVAPAELAVSAGFVLGAAAGHYLPYVRESVYAWDAATAVSLRDASGGWVETGARIEIAGLADTLARISDEGAQSLYTGSLARELAHDQRARGGLLTAQDLATYQPLVRKSLAFAAGDWELRTNPAPAIGGPVLAAMLALLGGRPHGPWTADDVRLLVEVQQRVLDFRRDRLDVTGDREAVARELLAGAGLGLAGSPSTVHVSVVDAEGTACAITSSSGYGSGMCVPGTGLWLNNCLGEHELNRGASAPAGARLASNMAPTVGRSADGAVLSIGSPGADRITTALVQVLAAFTRGHATLQEAVDRPRLHVHHLDGEQGLPADHPPVRVEAEEDLPLPELPLPVRVHPSRSMYFGGVGAALLDGSGALVAAADPRRDGAVGVSLGA